MDKPAGRSQSTAPPLREEAEGATIKSEEEGAEHLRIRPSSDDVLRRLSEWAAQKAKVGELSCALHSEFMSIVHEHA